MGNSAAADAVLSAQLQAAPNDPNALHLLGLIRMQQQRLNEAGMLLQRSLAISPNHIPARMNYGRLLVMAKRDVDAERCFRDILTLDPDQGDAHLELGNMLHQQNRAPDAEMHLQAAATRLPRNVRAHLALGAVLIDLKRLEEAETHLQQALALCQDPALRAKIHNNLVLAQRQLNKMEDALGNIAGAQALSAEYQYLDGIRADLLQKTNRHEEALAVLKQVLDREPQNPAAHYGYNSLLYRLGRHEELLSSYDRAPKSRDLRMSKGAMLAQLERMAEAEEIFSKLAEDFPGDTQVLSNAGAALSALSRHDEATGMLERALKIEPGNCFLMSRLASSLITHDRPDRAAQLAQQAMMMDPGNQSHLAMLTTALRLMEDPRHSELADYETWIRAFEIEAPEGWASIQDFNLELSSYLDRLHPDTREYFDQSLRFGTQTAERIFGAGHDLVDRLQKSIGKAVEQYIAGLRVNSANPFTGRRRAGYSYTGSWSSRLKTQGYHIDHIHPEGWISSCYYVSLPEIVGDTGRKQGWIKFGQPSMRQDLAPLAMVQPKPGTLILFPSFFWHGTTPFTSTQTRTTIAFDVVPQR
jgi:tetratricopeptide (TPR) repeat protein